MERYTDQELTKKMCDIYAEFYNIIKDIDSELIEKELNRRIGELSNQTHKESKYLKALLKDRIYQLTPKEQEIIKRVNTIIQQNRGITIVDRLKDASKEELIKYLQNIGASFATSKLNKIINGKNEEKAQQARIILERIKEIMEQQENQRKNDRQMSVYLQIKELFDEMVENGYFSINHFSKDVHNKYGLDFETFRDKINIYMSHLKAKYPEEYNKYQFRMEQNMWTSWEKNRQQIERMIELQEDYDIIDYYLYINLSPKTFLNLCRYMYGDDEYTRIKRFFIRYFEEPGYKPKNRIWSKMSSVERIKEEAVCQETQKMILSFMDEHSIPTNFFAQCLKKYMNGELDNYIYNESTKSIPTK